MTLFTNIGFSQSEEFKVYENGLIYSQNAISKLQKIVDSLNLKHKVCVVNPKYNSISQTTAHFISLEKNKVLAAKKDIENNISFDEFVSKYPKAILDKNLLVIKSHYDDYNQQKKILISSLEFNRNDDHVLYKDFDEVTSFLSEPIKGKWFYEYREKTDYSNESIQAFYFLDDFASKQIPSKYSKWIQYSDCLIDTTATVYLAQAKDQRTYLDTIPKKFEKFNDYVNQSLKRPNFSYENLDVLIGLDTINFEKPWKKIKLSKKERIKIEENRKIEEKKFHDFQDKMNKWESNRLSRLDSLKVNAPRFMTLFNEAYVQSTQEKFSDDEFEEYVGMYISKEAQLEMKRNRIVTGGCSMDQRPRIHALNIALLSAETIKWEIFLRSHLNIMNDRFDRISDGSYAQEARETYIKELEVLDINVLDLIIGISLRIENPASNHYYSSIGRMGRAISESNNTSTFENTLLEMISDDDLDDYNRVLMYFLFNNYNYFLKDEKHKGDNIKKLKSAVAKLPDSISSRITFN